MARHPSGYIRRTDAVTSNNGVYPLTKSSRPPMDPPLIALPQPHTTHHSILHQTTPPWSMAMNWHDLLFAHWPVSVESLRPHIPEELEIDTCDGTAWIGLVPFYM